MGLLVCSRTMLQCSLGAAPGKPKSLPDKHVLGGACSANIMDLKLMLNVVSPGICSFLINPTVASAISAISMVLTSFVPLTTDSLAMRSPTVLWGNMPALNDASTLMCNWRGFIKINMAGQFTTMVP